ncbi:hypothetical protein [Haloarcula onubensis]|uniref:Thoeris protein ThsB TIR-like domain-containing protein n=1 Tax=Haloarcula onubensis TaxID=2950539 RepID=A0ABU2FT94_9EURY|nr:hypothetical protein [Halomicroarcula sp. S3CR25-11]MDS0283980.1 hypothetical protein [Halomicroarcula sp. S3CR25-11]
MQIEIFTNGSGTTADRVNVESVDEFFKGGFLSIKDLSEKLSSYGDISIHILSKKYGYLQGSDPISELNVVEGTSAKDTQRFSDMISKASRTADVVIILLTKSVFEGTVSDQWKRLISQARRDSIWCIGASGNAVSSIDFEELRTKSTSVIVYERVGVARISTETKKELIEAVKQVSTN